MEKEKKIKVKKKIDWKHEMALAPGYIIVILWVAFTFMLLGWIIAASLSTTTDIFAGKALKFPSGLHFENYVQAWGSGGVATFFTNSLLYAVVSCVLLILICAPAAYVLARYTFIGNKIIQTSLVSAMGIPITMIVLPLFGVVANLGILNNVAPTGVPAPGRRNPTRRLAAQRRRVSTSRPRPRNKPDRFPSARLRPPLSYTTTSIILRQGAVQDEILRIKSISYRS